MSRDRKDDREGMEALAEDLEEEGALAPNPELERALREAEASYDARHTEKASPAASGGASAEELEALRAQLADAQDRLLRLQADFDNFRKRTLREREEAHQFGHQNLVKDLLSAVDNLERALEHARRSGPSDFDALLQGLELVHREIVGVLGKHGVTEIEAKGLPFDPSVHEAMTQMPDDSVPPNTVVQVFERGYRLRDRLLRPTKVVVSTPGAGNAGAKTSQEES